MKVITIQHKEVLKKLLEKGSYKANKSFVSENLLKPYEFASTFFGWDNIPIFLAPIGYKVEMYGAKMGLDYVAIELDIPKEYLKFQEYYNWSDFIYFLECPDEFKESFSNYKNVEDFGKDILDIKPNKSSKSPYQVMTSELKKEWITYILEDSSKLSERHNGTGGSNKLDFLKSYI